MVDVTQPVSNGFIALTIVVVLGITALGIAAVYVAKRQKEKRRIRDNA